MGGEPLLRAHLRPEAPCVVLGAVQHFPSSRAHSAGPSTRDRGPGRHWGPLRGAGALSRGPCSSVSVCPIRRHSALSRSGSDPVGGSGLDALPCAVRLGPEDSVVQGWRQGLLGPSWKPRGQVQGQAGSVRGRMPAGGFPETGHSSWERFPARPAPPGPGHSRQMGRAGRQCQGGAGLQTAQARTGATGGPVHTHLCASMC